MTTLGFEKRGSHASFKKGHAIIPIIGERTLDMIYLLHWKYKEGTDKFLDTLVECRCESQVDLAREMGVSVRTIGRNVTRLKKDGLLIVYRYEKNKLIYLVGEDAKMKWNKKQSAEILHFREKVSLKERTSQVSWSDSIVSSVQALEFDKAEKEFMDVEVDILVESLR
jgi:DNA-binding MarR family transcriptional regulator